jgi:hypothetical protein
VCSAESQAAFREQDCATIYTHDGPTFLDEGSAAIEIGGENSDMNA